MISGPLTRKQSVASALLAAMLLAGCAAPPSDAPQGEIIYLQSEEIRTLMQKMAVMVFNPRESLCDGLMTEVTRSA